MNDRDAKRPSDAINFPPSHSEGAGNAGRLVRPPPRVRRQRVESTRVSQVTPKTPGIPRAMVYGLFRALPGDRALLPPSPLRSLLLKNLTPASRRQDHTTSPSASAPFVKGASTSTASRSASVTIASRPSCGTRRAIYTSDLVFRKIGIFFRKGLDFDFTGCAFDLPVG